MGIMLGVRDAIDPQNNLYSQRDGNSGEMIQM